MKVPMSWIKQYLEIALEPSEMADKLTMAGVEVGLIERIGENWDAELVLVGVRLEGVCQRRSAPRLLTYHRRFLASVPEAW